MTATCRVESKEFAKCATHLSSTLFNLCTPHYAKSGGQPKIFFRSLRSHILPPYFQIRDAALGRVPRACPVFAIPMPKIPYLTKDPNMQWLSRESPWRCQGSVSFVLDGQKSLMDAQTWSRMFISQFVISLLTFVRNSAIPTDHPGFRIFCEKTNFKKDKC